MIRIRTTRLELLYSAESLQVYSSSCGLAGARFTPPATNILIRLGVRESWRCRWATTARAG